MNLLITTSPFFPHIGYLKDIKSCIDSEIEKYDWLVSDTDHFESVGLSDKYFTSSEFDEFASTCQVQFIFGVISALPKNSGMPTGELPCADGNVEIWQEMAKPQLQNSAFEIIFWDTTYMLIIGAPDSIANKFIMKFKHAVDLDSYLKMNAKTQIGYPKPVFKSGIWECIAARFKKSDNEELSPDIISRLRFVKVPASFSPKYIAHTEYGATSLVKKVWKLNSEKRWIEIDVPSDFLDSPKIKYFQDGATLRVFMNDPGTKFYFNQGIPRTQIPVYHG